MSVGYTRRDRVCFQRFLDEIELSPIISQIWEHHLHLYGIVRIPNFIWNYQPWVIILVFAQGIDVNTEWCVSPTSPCQRGCWRNLSGWGWLLWRWSWVVLASSSVSKSTLLRKLRSSLQRRLKGVNMVSTLSYVWKFTCICNLFICYLRFDGNYA